MTSQTNRNLAKEAEMFSVNANHCGARFAPRRFPLAKEPETPLVNANLPRWSRGEWPMKANRSLWIFLALVTILVLLPGSGAAQEQQEGKNSGNYNVRQTIEFGGRLTSFT